MREVKGADIVFRSAVHPNFRKKKKAFDARQFFRLSNVQGGLESSLVWQYLAPTLDHVHAFGARLAASLNERDPGTRSVYCGSYALSVDNVRSLVGIPELNEVAAADVVHKIENGEIAHAALEIKLSDKKPDTVTAIVDRLWNAASGPAKCVLNGDEDLSPHPGESLASPPNGGFRETRCFARVAFDRVAFKAYREPKARKEMRSLAE